MLLIISGNQNILKMQSFFKAGLGGALSSPVYISIDQIQVQSKPAFFKNTPSRCSMIPNFPITKGIAIINGHIIDTLEIFDEMIKA